MVTDKRRVYLAAPLFSPVERSFNAYVAAKLEARFEVFMPQRDGILLPGRDLTRDEFRELSAEVYEADRAAIRQSDILFAVLDGRTVDEGVAVEIGLACGLGKTCVGFHSDARVLLPFGLNPMIEGALQTVLRSVEELDAWIEQEQKT